MQASRNEMWEFFTSIEGIPNKGKGGCLFFCFAFFRWLQKHGFDTNDFTILQIDSFWHQSKSNNVAFIQTGEGQPEAAWHFVWKYCDELYDGNSFDNDPDTNGYTPVDLFPLLNSPGFFETRDQAIEQFCIRALNHDSWNTMFSRGYAKDVMRHNLDLEFDEIVTEF